MKIKKKILTLTLSISMFIFSTPAANALSQTMIPKTNGSDIYNTAGLIADNIPYPETIILVNLDNSIADGLSASGLSGALDAPVLLSKKDSLPKSTSIRLRTVKKVYIIGGTNSISQSIENNLKDKNINVKRIYGNDRIQTSYKIAKEISSLTKVTQIMLTNAYKGEADAISIASTSARNKTPIILTNGQNIPFKTDNIKSYAIGGNSSMSDKLVKDANSIRLGGKDRFETNTKIIKYFYKDFNKFTLVDSSKLNYALVAACNSRHDFSNMPILLVSKDSDKSILKNAGRVNSVGPISNDILKQCKNAINSVQASKDVDNYTPKTLENELKIIKEFNENMNLYLAVGYDAAERYYKSVEYSTNMLFSKHLDIESDSEIYEAATDFMVSSFSVGSALYVNLDTALLYRDLSNEALDNLKIVKKSSPGYENIYIPSIFTYNQSKNNSNINKSIDKKANELKSRINELYK